MIEMLITLVIISIGLLGVAALQSRGQLATQASYIVTQSVTQAYNIMDKMRANAAFARQDALDNGTATGNGYITNTAPGGSVDCLANACTPANLRTFDLNEWYAELARTLPSGTARISVPVAPATGATTVTYLISIQWRLKDAERSDGDTGLRQQQWSLTL